MSETDFNRIFSIRLKYYLEKYEMTQAQLAKKLGVGTSSVSNWCQGQKNPRMDKIDKMCDIFHCKRSDLITEPSDTSITSALNDPEEEKLVSTYRSLNDSGKQKLIDRAEELVELGYAKETSLDSKIG